MDIGDIGKAKIFCEKAIEVDSKNASAYSILGVVFIKKGQYKEAVACFKRAINIDPTYMDPYINLGFSYVQMRNFIEAKRIWEIGLEINPQCAQIQNNLKELDLKELK
jgi:Tfp pilus assembly protein PilF